MATVVVAARYVPRPPDDALWIGGPTRSAFYLLTAALQLYSPAPPRVFTPGDTSSDVWYRRPQSNFNLLLGGSAPVVLPFRPNFNAVLSSYDVNAPIWVGRPRGNDTLLLVGPPTFFGAKGQSPTHRWNFDMVPETLWTGRPPGAFLVNTPAPPPAPKLANQFRLRLGIALGLGGL